VGSGLVLRNNGSDNLTVSANSAVTFATALASGAPYNVTVLTQPASPSQTCVVTNGSGTVGSSNVTNVAVTCTTNSYTIGGTVSGLAGSGLVLRSNGGDNLAVSVNGAFTFATALVSGATYSVSVFNQPTSLSQTCIVTNGAGTVDSGNIVNVVVVCTTNTYTIGGTVSGLTGSGLALRNNGGNDLAITVNGTFTFSAGLAMGATYNVSALTQPTSPSQTCVVTNGNGTVGNGNISNVAVVCTTNAYTIGGTVSGLVGSGLVLRNNGGDNLTVLANGAVTFATAVASGAAYSVTVLSHPGSPSQTCAVVSGSGVVVSGSITNVAVACTTNTYTIGGSVTGLTGSGLVLRNNGTNNLTVNANGAFVFGTNVPSGGGYSVTVANQPTNPVQNCTVGNGFGTVSNFNITAIAVDCVNGGVVGRFAYVVDYFDNTVSIYTVNPTTGQLRHNGYVPVGVNPQSVVVDPSGRFVYLANRLSNNISAFRINPNTGALQGIPGMPISVGVTPLSVVVDPSGRFAYVVSSASNTVSAFSINPTSGALVAIGSPYGTGANPGSVTVDPTGKFAYVANRGSGTVTAFSINSNTGALSAEGSPFAVGTAPSSVTIDPTGKFAYVANQNSNNVSAFAINSNTGGLTEVAGSPFTTGAGPFSITVDPTGKFAYVANVTANTVSAFSINANSGFLTPVANSPFAAGNGPFSIKVDPSGKFAYVASPGTNSVLAFAINLISGALTPLPPVVTRHGPADIAFTKGTSPITYAPKFAYVTNFSSDSVSAFRIDAGSGALTSIGADVATNRGPNSVTVDPFGKFAYVANLFSGDISSFRINATTGALTSAGVAVAAGAGAHSISIHPSGMFAYVANNSSNTISTFRIDSITGALTRIGADWPTGTGPSSVTIVPSGKFAYVTNQSSNGVTTYRIDSITGELTGVFADVPTGAGPRSISIDPSGRYAYVTNQSANSVSAFRLDAFTGALTSIGPAVAAGDTPNSVNIDPAGKFAYVTNLQSDNVSVFRIDSATGALTSMGAPVTVGDGPYFGRIEASGNFIYVANFNNTISTFRVNANTGALTSAGSDVGVGFFPTSITTTSVIQSDIESSVTINLSSPTLGFYAARGGPNPPAQVITVTSDDSGALSGLTLGSIAYGPGGSGWLQLPAINSASAPATVTVQSVTGSLAEGTYTATIPVLSSTASNSPQHITVTLTVASGGIPCPVAGAPTITIGEVQSGSLTTTDCVLPFGGYADFYRFDVAVTTDVVIDLTTTAFSPGLQLLDASTGAVVTTTGTVVTTGPLGTQRARLTRRLSAGSYIIQSFGNSSRELGAYQLSVATTMVPIPLDGFWQGWTDVGHVVRFFVQFNKVIIFTVDLGPLVDSAGRQCPSAYEVSFASAEISGSSFAFSWLGGAKIGAAVSGSIDSPVTAAGNISNILLDNYVCRSNGSVWQGQSSDRTWTATRQ